MVVISPLTHAAPAEVVVASEAVHVRAATILLNAGLAVWALAHVAKEEESKESNRSFTRTSSFVPCLLAAETCVRATLFAHNSDVLILTLDRTFTL